MGAVLGVLGFWGFRVLGFWGLGFRGVGVVLEVQQSGISPAFAFPSDILQFLAVYMSIAHICCACRSLERSSSRKHISRNRLKTQEHACRLKLALHLYIQLPCKFKLERSLGQKQHWDKRTGFGKAHLQSWRFGLAGRCLTLVYSPALLLLLISFLTSHDFYPGHAGDFSCFPCRCSQEGILKSFKLSKVIGLRSFKASSDGLPPPRTCHRTHRRGLLQPRTRTKGVRRLKGL